MSNVMRHENASGRVVGPAGRGSTARDVALVLLVVGAVIAIAATAPSTTYAYAQLQQIGAVVGTIQSGDLLLPRNQMGVLAHKPQLYTWLDAAVLAATGIYHDLTFRMPTVAASLVAGVLVYRTGVSRVDALAGMGRTAPWTAAVMTIAGLSMIGVPMTAGFLSKWYLGAGALEAGRISIVPVLMASSLFTAMYVWRLVQLVWFAPKDTEPMVKQEAPWSMRIPALALAAACLYFGLTSTSVDLARDAAASLGWGTGP